MPELPEVETVRRQLKDRVGGNRIESIEIHDGKLDGVDGLVGRTVLFVCRRGKGLSMMLDDGRSCMIHLRMTGRLLWKEGRPELMPHVRLTIRFTGGWLHLIDPRRFATVTKSDTPVPCALPVGAGERFYPQLFEEAGKKRSVPIKTLLMDQQVVAGIGNIYASEILHAAAMHPLRRTCDVSPADWSSLVDASLVIMNHAIACRGTTVSDWRDLHGRAGEYQRHLRVYKKTGTPCPRCGAPIQRTTLGGRGTFLCPSCQI